MRDLKDLQAKGDLPQFKDKLEAYKQEFGKHALVISEEVYVELKAKP